MDQLKLVSMTEAAEYVGVSRVTMSKLVNAGRFTVYEDPRDSRKKLLDLDEVVREMTPRAIHQPRREGDIPKLRAAA